MPNRITGADEITRIERVPEWKQRIDDFAETNPIEFEYDPEKGFMAPRLVCTSISVSEARKHIAGYSAIASISVTNRGNGVSFSSYVEMYRKVASVSSYKLRDYRILTINPGQTVDVQLKLKRCWKEIIVVGVCFDPFLDPRGFQIEELNDDIHLNELVKHNDHITSIQCNLDELIRAD